MLVENKIIGDKKFHALQVTRLDLRDKLLCVEDAVSYDGYSKEQEEWKPFEKVVISCTEYGKNKDSVNIKVFVDLDDFLIIANDIINQKEITFKDYKGSKSDKYTSGQEARYLEVGNWVAPDGKGFYTFSLKAGEGIRGDKGQVSLKPGADWAKSVKLQISIADARRAFIYAKVYFEQKVCAFLANNYNTLYTK